MCMLPGDPSRSCTLPPPPCNPPQGGGGVICPKKYRKYQGAKGAEEKISFSCTTMVWCNPPPRPPAPVGGEASQHWGGHFKEGVRHHGIYGCIRMIAHHKVLCLTAPWLGRRLEGLVFCHVTLLLAGAVDWLSSCETILLFVQCTSFCFRKVNPRSIVGFEARFIP